MLTTVYLLIVLFLGLVVVAAVTERLGCGADVFVLLLACMMLVLQFVHLGLFGVAGSSRAVWPSPRRGHRTHMGREAFAEGSSGSGGGSHQEKERARQRAIDEGVEDVSGFDAGLTVYASSFSAASFPDGGGKLWRNIVAVTGEDSKGSSNNDNDKNGTSSSDLHFHFLRSPAFSRRDGFKLFTNTIAGPPSFRMGIRGDMAFAIFLLCQFTGELPPLGPRDEGGGAATGRGGGGGGGGDANGDGEGAAVMYRLYANTPGNNGVSLVAYDASGSGSGGEDKDKDKDKEGGGPSPSTSSAVRRVGLRLNFGDHITVDCATNDGEPLEVQRDHKYLIVVSKTMDDRLIVQAVDVHSPMPHVLRLADQQVDAQRVAPVDFSNRDMELNERANWSAHLQAFGCYDRPMSERDVVTLFDHYKAMFERFDPTYIRLMDRIEELSRLRSCPYDERTCSACSADVPDGDWTNPQNIATASQACRREIGAFCRRNPNHPRCTCWSTSHPEYRTRCRPYRCLFGGGDEDDCRDAGSGSGRDEGAGERSSYVSVAAGASSESSRGEREKQQQQQRKERMTTLSAMRGRNGGGRDPAAEARAESQAKLAEKMLLQEESAKSDNGPQIDAKAPPRDTTTTTTTTAAPPAPKEGGGEGTSGKDGAEPVVSQFTAPSGERAPSPSQQQQQQQQPSSTVPPPESSSSPSPSMKTGGGGGRGGGILGRFVDWWSGNDDEDM